jgi:hypothetical protein
LAEHKFWLFLISALLLLLSYWTLRKSENTCPVDPVLAQKCRLLQRWNRWVFRAALIIWGIGFFSAYLAAPLASVLGANP